MSLLLKIAERTLNRPLLVHPDKLPLILGVLEELIGRAQARGPAQADARTHRDGGRKGRQRFPQLHRIFTIEAWSVLRAAKFYCARSEPGRPNYSASDA